MLGNAYRASACPAELAVSNGALGRRRHAAGPRPRHATWRHAWQGQHGSAAGPSGPEMRRKMRHRDGEQIFTQGTGPRTIETSGGQGTFSLALRAERMNPFLGRSYRTTCTATDAAGNVSAQRKHNVNVP